ncbi:hypothetical protein NDU88_002299 [Pleurodeles waltl]|uniref:Uncharacterized protein n=1 Tax=Pleurodeles waltl TaxID=8319 RepID=A0AAV7WPT3_PLEWA|nr:hypothetical protein NDU88_002299 [Pleurodeles waltl]
MGSIPPYPWGTSAVAVPDQDADRSGTYPHTHPGDEGICKSLLNVAQERTGERGAVDKMGATAVRKRMVAASVAAAVALRETAAAPGKPAAAKEADPAPDAGTTATPGGAAREGG